MKIYYTNSTAEFDLYKERYFYIRELIINKGHILTRDWLTLTDKKLHTSDMTNERIKVVYKECIQALKEAEIVIIEDTVSNFSTGHQITLALEMQKPTLVLWGGKKHKYFSKMFIHGVDSDYLEVVQYKNLSDLDNIISIFINKYEDIELKNRFHLVLNNPERRYLDWAQFYKGISRTKIIKNAINKELDSDSEYIDYLAAKK